jgi:hypothetical protein
MRPESPVEGAGLDPRASIAKPLDKKILECVLRGGRQVKGKLQREAAEEIATQQRLRAQAPVRSQSRGR